MERNTIGLFCIRFIRFNCFLLVIPDSDEFICSTSDDQWFSDTNIHAVNNPRVEWQTDLLKLLFLFWNELCVIRLQLGAVNEVWWECYYKPFIRYWSHRHSFDLIYLHFTISFNVELLKEQVRHWWIGCY